jgi:glutaredoxin 3
MMPDITPSRRLLFAVPFIIRLHPATAETSDPVIVASALSQSLIQLPMTNKTEPTPILYTKQACPWCKQARDVLVERNISYREISVSDSDEAYKEMQRLSGQSYVPVLNWGGKILADFGADELRPFLDDQAPRE